MIRVLAAMLNPAPTAADRRIEIGLYETGLHLAARDLAGMQLKTQLLGRLEKEGGGEFSMPGYGSYLTADSRWIYLLILTDAHWAKLTKALDMPEDGDPPGGRPPLADQHSDGGRFAGPVRPEQPEQLPLADVQVQPVDGDERAVRDPQPVDVDGRLGHGRRIHHKDTKGTKKATVG